MEGLEVGDINKGDIEGIGGDLISGDGAGIKVEDEGVKAETLLKLRLSPMILSATISLTVRLEMVAVSACRLETLS